VTHFAVGIAAEEHPQFPHVRLPLAHASGHSSLRTLSQLLGKLLGLGYLEGVTRAKTASDLVGRAGLDPATLGLKVSVVEFQGSSALIKTAYELLVCSHRSSGLACFSREL
jgi:hypothetical protein